MMQIKIIEHYKRGEFELKFDLHSPEHIEGAAKAIGQIVKIASDLMDGPGGIQVGEFHDQMAFTWDEPETTQESEPVEAEEPENYDQTEKKTFRITKAKLALFQDKTGVADEKIARHWITEAEGDADEAVTAYLVKHPTPEIEEVAEKAEAEVTYDQLCQALTAKASAMPEFLADFQNYMASEIGKPTLNTLEPALYGKVLAWIESYGK